MKSFLSQNWLIIVTIILLIISIWFAVTIIRLENYHYAVQVGFCADVSVSERDACLRKIETRTHPLYHLFYGLEIF